MTDQAIRDEYGVNFLIRSSIQVMGKSARLNLEISDLKIGEIVETKKRDFVMDEIFKVQDELSDQILEILQIDLGTGSHLKMWVNRFDTMEDFTKFLNWIQLWRTYNPKNHEKTQKILDDMRKSYDEEHTTMYVMESWQIYQRLGLNLSKNKEEDLKRLKYIVNRNIELHPENSDAYNARALIGLSYFGFSCEQAIADIDRAEKNGSNQETLLIGSGVYSRCGQVEEAISRLQELLRIVPNDPGWFQTGMLVTMLYWDGKHSEIYDLIGQKIAASDMDPRVLAIYSILEFKKGNEKKAVEYFVRSKKNGFNNSRLGIGDEKIKTEALDILEQIEKISKS
jgi:tetratricopeptide (TPR) repeat protein